jgi:hypothetical protein
MERVPKGKSMVIKGEWAINGKRMVISIKGEWAINGKRISIKGEWAINGKRISIKGEWAINGKRMVISIKSANIWNSVWINAHNRIQTLV